MFCPNCGKEIENSTRFCPKCGTLQTFVPQQNVPHHFQPYSLEEKKEQHLQRLKVLADPFAEDELPEEKTVQKAPAVDPFGNPLQEASVFGDSFDGMDALESSDEEPRHMAVRLAGSLLLMVALILAATNAGGRVHLFKIIGTLPDQWRLIFSLSNLHADILKPVVEVALESLYCVGTLFLGIIGIFKFIFGKYRMKFVLIALLLCSVGGIIVSGGVSVARTASIPVTLIAIVAFIVNRFLPPKIKEHDDDDGIVIPDDAPNPLL